MKAREGKYIFEPYSLAPCIYKCITDTDTYYCDVILTFFHSIKYSRFFDDLQKYQVKYEIQLQFATIIDHWGENDKYYVIRKSFSEFNSEEVEVKALILEILQAIKFAIESDYHVCIACHNLALEEDSKRIIIKDPYVLFYASFPVKEYYNNLRKVISEFYPNSPYIEKINDDIPIADLISLFKYAY